MAIRHLGYACICMSLGKSVSTNRSTVLRTFSIERASSLALSNAQDLKKILEWNTKNGIKFFRISSTLFPFMTHESVGYDFKELPLHVQIAKALKDAGTVARKHGIRLNSHPGPFTILASPNKKVVDATIRDLEMHSLVADLIDNDESETPFNINFHMGSDYGDKKEAAKRYVENLDRLSPAARKRVSVENDDKGKLFSVRDLHELIYQKSGVPIVFDVHHHQFCTGGMKDVDASKLALKTWGKGVPEIHYSESRTIHNSTLEKDEKIRPTAHSDYITGRIPDYDGTFDVMVECKAKDLAILKYRSKYFAYDVPDECCGAIV